MKSNRAYNCLLFQSHYDYFICVPYRTEINHSNAYHFKYSRRSKEHKSGLDYSKIIIASDSRYVGADDAIIDKDEYNETIRNIHRIKREALKYVDDYVAYRLGKKMMHEREYKRKYGYSTLRYFHKELGIVD